MSACRRLSWYCPASRRGLPYNPVAVNGRRLGEVLAIGAVSVHDPDVVLLHEGYPLAVEREVGRELVRRVVGQLLAVRAVGVHGVDLAVLIRVRIVLGVSYFAVVAREGGLRLLLRDRDEQSHRLCHRHRDRDHQRQIERPSYHASPPPFARQGRAPRASANDGGSITPGWEWRYGRHSPSTGRTPYATRAGAVCPPEPPP